MTGFGSSKSKGKRGVVTAEIKTVNHKFLELSIKLPPSLYIFEDKVKEVLETGIKRGKVYFNLMFEGSTASGDVLYLDVPLAKSYYHKLNDLKKVFKLEEKISLKDIVAFPGVINYRVSEKQALKAWPLVEDAIKKALKKLIIEREREGRHLAMDLAKRCATIKKHLNIIKDKAHLNVKNYKKKLEDRITEISNIPPANNDRLEMEVALFAKNSDITEEITRLTAHIVNFDRVLKQKGETGKKFDFIAQEMHREVNTIGSKSGDYNISMSVIEMKSEIEKIREQVKNIE